MRSPVAGTTFGGICWREGPDPEIDGKNAFSMTFPLITNTLSGHKMGKRKGRSGYDGALTFALSLYQYWAKHGRRRCRAFLGCLPFLPWKSRKVRSRTGRSQHCENRAAFEATQRSPTRRRALAAWKPPSEPFHCEAPVSRKLFPSLVQTGPGRGDGWSGPAVDPRKRKPNWIRGLRRSTFFLSGLVVRPDEGEGFSLKGRLCETLPDFARSNEKIGLDDRMGRADIRLKRGRRSTCGKRCWKVGQAQGILARCFCS